MTGSSPHRGRLGRLVGAVPMLADDEWYAAAVAHLRRMQADADAAAMAFEREARIAQRVSIAMAVSAALLALALGVDIVLRLM